MQRKHKDDVIESGWHSTLDTRVDRFDVVISECVRPDYKWRSYVKAVSQNGIAIDSVERFHRTEEKAKQYADAQIEYGQALVAEAKRRSANKREYSVPVRQDPTGV